MPSEAEFQELLKRVEELEAFRALATEGLLNHMEGINTHDKVIQELQQNFKAIANNVMKGFEKLTAHLNTQR